MTDELKEKNEQTTREIYRLLNEIMESIRELRRKQIQMELDNE